MALAVWLLCLRCWMQERQMLQEEQQQWERLSPNQAELQVGLLKITIIGSIKYKM